MKPIIPSSQLFLFFFFLINSTVSSRCYCLAVNRIKLQTIIQLIHVTRSRRFIRFDHLSPRKLRFPVRMESLFEHWFIKINPMEINKWNNMCREFDALNRRGILTTSGQRLLIKDNETLVMRPWIFSFVSRSRLYITSSHQPCDHHMYFRGFLLLHLVSYMLMTTNKKYHLLLRIPPTYPLPNPIA